MGFPGRGFLGKQVQNRSIWKPRNAKSCTKGAFNLRCDLQFQMRRPHASQSSSIRLDDTGVIINNTANDPKRYVIALVYIGFREVAHAAAGRGHFWHFSHQFVCVHGFFCFSHHAPPHTLPYSTVRYRIGRSWTYDSDDQDAVT